MQGNLDAVTDQEYWQVDVLEGTFEGSGVILPIRDEFFMESIDQAAVAEAASLEVPFQSLGRFETTGDLTTGSVTSSELVTMNFLTIGAIQQETGTELNVFNAVSPNDDGLNDILKIQNITLFPNNIVTIYTRWGDKVFEMAGYDNDENVFKGFSNVRNTKELPEGTYYYVIEKGDGSSNLNGFFVLRN